MTMVPFGFFNRSGISIRVLYEFVLVRGHIEYVDDELQIFFMRHAIIVVYKSQNVDTKINYLGPCVVKVTKRSHS